MRATLFVLCVFLTGLDATNRALSAELANPLLGEWVIYDPATGAGGLCLQFKSDKTVWCRGFDARKPAERGELMWSATYDLRSTGTVFLSFDQSAPNAAPVPYKSKEYHYKINRQNVDGKNRSFLLLDVFPNALYFHFLE